MCFISIVYWPPDPAVPQPPQKTCKNQCMRAFKSIAAFINTYFEQSSIHGVGYLAKAELTWAEKIVWFILMVLSLASCIIIGLQSVDRFYNKNTIVGMECDYLYWNTTGPSMTICPMKRLSEELYNDFCRANRINGTQKDELFHFLETFANTTFTNADLLPEYDGVDKIFHDLNIQPADYMSLIYNLTLDLSRTPEPKLRIHSILGDKAIQNHQVLTEFGLCYLTSTHLSEKYSSRYFIFGENPDPYSSEEEETLPRAIASDIYTTEVRIQFGGFRSETIVYIHSAFEPMRVDAFFAYSFSAFEFSTDAQDMLVENNLVTAATPSQRKCLFQHESNLPNFPVYSKNFCIQQCRLELSYKLCNCIPHFYPNRVRDPKPVCSYRKLKECFYKNSDFLLKLYKPHSKVKFTCECLGVCRDSFVRVIKRTSIRNADYLFNGNTGLVLFRNNAHRRYKRQIIFTFTDLLVSIGGTAGLFLGFSVLGAIEVIYFFTMRLVCSLCGRRM